MAPASRAPRTSRAARASRTSRAAGKGAARATRAASRGRATGTGSRAGARKGGKAAKAAGSKRGRQAPAGRRRTASEAGGDEPRPPASQRQARHGLVAHTELVSSDPAATQDWAAKVLGWSFGDPMQTPDGPYHMWRFDDRSGGGIRGQGPGEQTGAVPYVEVRDLRKAFDLAVAAGAQPVQQPQDLPGDNGAVAVVQAPGGCLVGLWGTRL